MHTQKVLLVPGTSDTFEIQEISFEVQSEDLGQKVIALLYVDLKGLYTPNNPANIKYEELDPGTLKSKRPRTTFELDFNNPVQTAGCHSVTVVTSHDFFIAPQPADPTDVDTATWFYYVGVKPSDTEFKGCPPVSRPGDAGADARDGSN